MFRTVPLSIIRGFSLYTQQWYMTYRFADSWVPSWTCSQAVSKPVWHIALLCVQWNPSDDGQRNCPKHVDFYSKDKFEKLVHLVGFIIRTIYHTNCTHISEMCHPRCVYKLIGGGIKSITQVYLMMFITGLKNYMFRHIPKEYQCLHWYSYTDNLSDENLMMAGIGRNM